MFQLSTLLTPLVRNVLLCLAFVLMVQWGIGQSFVDLFAWHSLSAGFQPWQPLTAVLIASPSLSNMFFDWLVIFFSLATVDRLMGRRALLQALAFSWVLSLAGVFVLDLAGGLKPSLFAGQNGLTTALLCLFCFGMPRAQVMLFFVLPVQASWMGWGTGLIAVYFAAANRDVGAFVMLFSWLAAVLWTFGFSDWTRRLKLRLQRRQAEKRLGRFSVIEGGKGKDDWVH